VKGGKNMVDQGIVQVSMDNELKKQAEEIFDKIGIDMSTAVRMFFKATVSVYTARTATRARSFCPPLPLTAHGHCPAKCDILDMARNA